MGWAVEWKMAKKFQSGHPWSSHDAHTMVRATLVVGAMLGPQHIIGAIVPVVILRDSQNAF